jgi:methylthioribose-1-phosphate isomerase
MAAMVLSKGWVDAILVGSDRVTANGDTANKVGTLNLSILARYFGIPFYVATPTPTLDFTLTSGEEIPIEERDAQEITHFRGTRVTPEGIRVFNPAFDVSPHENITAIVTERGIAWPPFTQSLRNLVGNTKSENPGDV